MQIQKIKPYVFILVIFVFPLLVITLLDKMGTPDSKLQVENQRKDEPRYGLVIHGGAGNFTETDFSRNELTSYRELMDSSLQKGMAMLQKGDSALEVVVEVIKILEDSPLFNAGKGAVYTHEGTHELDAAIMEGKNRKAGSVAGVSQIKNPIAAAYQVLKHTKHVMLIGSGAEDFARLQQLEMVEPSYFSTEKQRIKWEKSLQKEKKMGTVGCVVLDQYGNLAAGTSTGGMTNKMKGRVGDSPIIGAGTYADNQTCAISATGHGEFFIRYTVAADIAARMKYLEQEMDVSAEQVISELKKNAGDGGVIGIDKNGKVTMKFNTLGMFRGYVLDGEKTVIRFFNEFN